MTLLSYLSLLFIVLDIIINDKSSKDLRSSEPLNVEKFLSAKSEAKMTGPRPSTDSVASRGNIKVK